MPDRAPREQSFRDAEYVIVGRIRRAHGLGGDVVVEPYTDAPETLLAGGCRVLAGDTKGEIVIPPRELHIAESSPRGEGLVVRFEEIGSRDVAGQWRDRFLLVPSGEVAAAAEGEIFIHDLVGLRVELADGTTLGTVSTFYELAQGLMLEVKSAEREFLLPYRDEFIESVDQEGRRLVVNLPEGFLE